MKRYSTRGLLLAAVTASVALPAAAQVDQQCIQRWQQAMSTRLLGERCQSIDAATSAKLKALEDASLACAMAKASAADKAQLQTSLPDVQKETAQALANTPCDQDTKATIAGHAKQQVQK
jgi:hypothetical protein